MDAGLAAAAVSGIAQLEHAGAGEHGGIRVEAVGTERTTSTTSEGRFRLQLTPGEQTLRFNFAGYAPVERVVEVPSELLDPVLLVALPGRIVGRVQLPPGYEGEGAFDDAYAALQDVEPSQRVALDADGGIAFDRVPVGEHVVLVSVPGFTGARRDVAVGAGQRVDLGVIELRAQDTDPVAATAVEGVARLQGVRSDDGHGGIRVESIGTPFATVATSSGRFHLDLTPGPHQLRFGFPGYGVVELSVLDIARGETHRLADEVVLGARPGRVFGAVRLLEFSDDERLQDAQIRLVDEAQSLVRAAEPGPDGAFALDDVPPGPYTLVASAPGYEVVVLGVDLRPGEAEHVGQISLRHHSRSAAAVPLGGRVRLEASADHSGTVVDVRFAGRGLSLSRAVTGPDGRFEVAASPDERYALVVSRSGYEVPAAPVVEWDAESAGFRDEDGQPFDVELAVSRGPDGDGDGDGVRNGDDVCPDTADPEQADLDADGIGDACDADVDGDGLTNREEALLGTSVEAADTDADGLSDFVEVRRLGTDPLQRDTDQDGVDDAEEVGDPDAPMDRDGDGRHDAVESRARDEDGDGASDELDGPGPMGDRDGDGVLNGRRDDEGVCVDAAGCDVCFAVADALQLDADDDGQGDAPTSAKPSTLSCAAGRWPPKRAIQTRTVRSRSNASSLRSVCAAARYRHR